MALQTSPSCRCIYCTHAATSICDKCKSSRCARAQWHGFMCNVDAADRHKTTKSHQTKTDPIRARVKRGAKKS